MSTEQGNGAGASARTVTQAEFLMDSRALLKRAELEGPLTITDANGIPRMSIHRPREKVPFIDE